MKTISLSKKSDMLHIEAPGCIINIKPGLSDREGHDVVHVEVLADGDRYSGNPQWWIEGKARSTTLSGRVVQTNVPLPPEAVPISAGEGYRIDSADMPAILIGLDRFLDAEKAANNDGRSLGKRGLADDLARIRADLVRQRDAQDATLVGFVVSDPAGHYDSSKTMTRDAASTICRENGEGWAYGAVFASGRVTFEV